MSSVYFGSMAGMALMVLVLLGLLGLLTAALWAWSRRRAPRGSARSSIELLERKPLGPHHAMCLVRVGGKVFFLGQGPQGLQVLGELSEGWPAEAPEPPSPSFEGWLQQAATLGRKTP